MIAIYSIADNRIPPYLSDFQRRNAALKIYFLFIV